jgi:hypothetical protein
MKRVIISLTVLFIFLSGCVDYKAYDIKEESQEEIDLVNEIAKIEKDLAIAEKNLPIDELVVEEEIILPDLDEEPAQSSELRTIQVKENELVKLKTTIIDADNDPVQYTYTLPLNKSGAWQTNYGDAGEYVVTLSATDGKLTTTQRIMIQVERVNVPPVITGIRDLFISEGETVNFEPQVSDPNGDAVTISISEPLKSGSFVTDHTSSGEYQIKVSASDGELETAANFKLTIRDVNELPQISNLQDISIEEGEVVRIEPVVTDLDEDEVIVSISEPVGDDGIWETSFTDHGKYTVTVTANDGKDIVRKKISLTVADVNVAPEIVNIELDLN